jgi:aminopeptidase N
MLAKIAAFELRYQLRSPLFFVACAIFFLLTFGATTIDQIQIGARGNVNINSPYAILQTVAIMTVFALFVVVAFVANVVIRDDETGFAPIIRATRVSKRDYLLGRFIGATIVAFLVLWAVALGILVGSFMPWLDHEKVGPFNLAHYAYSLFFFALPTLMVMAAGFFALAVLTRSMMATYVGAVAFLVAFFVARGALRDPQWDSITALLDPFGLSALTLVTKYWTASDRNTLLPAMEGALLANRALWLGVSFGLLALAYALFRFETRGQRPSDTPATAGKGGKAASEAPPAVPALAARAPVQIATRGGLGQMLALARFDMAFVFRSPAFFVLLAIGLLNTLGSLWFTTGPLGTELFPVTRLMITQLEGAFSIIPLIIAIYYSGELVWRDRQQRMHEIVDATPAPDWAFVLPKILAIVLVLLATLLVSVLAAVAVQLIKGYTNLELAAYFWWYLLPMTIGFGLLAVLAVFSQAIVPNKFFGWAFMLVYVVASITLGQMGFEHHLYSYGSTTQVPLSDMNGMGRFWIGRAWLQLYWGAFAVLLVVASYGLWRRGTELRLKPRLARLPRRLRGPAGAVAAIAGLVFIGTGAWIFYNNNVLNEYVPTPAFEARQAEYEKALLPYEKVVQPRITDVAITVELFPRDVRVLAHGTYKFTNRSAAPITELHVRLDPRAKFDELKLDGAKQTKVYEQFNYRIYTFDTPLQPGETRALSFRTRLEEKGFPAMRPLTRVVENGTFVNNFELLPSFGMNRNGLLQERAKRRKYGLEPEQRMAKLEDDSARANHGLRNDADWVNADITVVTDADQVPVAPGYKVEEVSRDGRIMARFKTDAPIHFFFSIQSARYSDKRETLKLASGNEVDLVVYYHAPHVANVQRMLDTMRTSIELFSTMFSPYQFRQARVIEFPGYADFAQAFANTMPYSEGIGFIVNHKDDTKIDLVTYVTAHEVAHQWWAHQVAGADQQGSTMLVETFAQYSALLVMEQLYGKEQVRRFLKYELDRYLRDRGGEVIEELPLARVENQPYIHYRKGTLVMYWLREVVGTDTVNRAMRRLIEQYAFKPAPYPNSRDFLRLLRSRSAARRAHHRSVREDHAVRRQGRRGQEQEARRRQVRGRADGGGEEALCRRQGQGDRGAAGRGIRHRRVHRRAGQEGLWQGQHPVVRAPADQERAPDADAGGRPRAEVRRHRPVQQAHRSQLRRQPEGGRLARRGRRGPPTFGPGYGSVRPAFLGGAAVQAPLRCPFDSAI